MDNQLVQTHSFKEIKIGKTIYKVTSFFSGEKDLGKTLEQIAIRNTLSDFSSYTNSKPLDKK